MNKKIFIFSSLLFSFIASPIVFSATNIKNTEYNEKTTTDVEVSFESTDVGEVIAELKITNEKNIKSLEFEFTNNKDSSNIVIYKLKDDEIKDGSRITIQDSNFLAGKYYDAKMRLEYYNPDFLPPVIHLTGVYISMKEPYWEWVNRGIYSYITSIHAQFVIKDLPQDNHPKLVFDDLYCVIYNLDNNGSEVVNWSIKECIRWNNDLNAWSAAPTVDGLEPDTNYQLKIFMKGNGNQLPSDFVADDIKNFKTNPKENIGESEWNIDDNTNEIDDDDKYTSRNISVSSKWNAYHIYHQSMIKKISLTNIKEKNSLNFFDSSSINDVILESKDINKLAQANSNKIKEFNLRVDNLKPATTYQAKLSMEYFDEFVDEADWNKEIEFATIDKKSAPIINETVLDVKQTDEMANLHEAEISFDIKKDLNVNDGATYKDLESIELEIYENGNPNPIKTEKRDSSTDIPLAENNTFTITDLDPNKEYSYKLITNAPVYVNGVSPLENVFKTNKNFSFDKEGSPTASKIDDKWSYDKLAWNIEWAWEYEKNIKNAWYYVYEKGNYNASSSDWKLIDKDSSNNYKEIIVDKLNPNKEYDIALRVEANDETEAGGEKWTEPNNNIEINVTTFKDLLLQKTDYQPAPNISNLNLNIFQDEILFEFEGDNFEFLDEMKYRVLDENSNELSNGSFGKDEFIGNEINKPKKIDQLNPGTKYIFEFTMEYDKNITYQPKWDQINGGTSNNNVFTTEVITTYHKQMKINKFDVSKNKSINNYYDLTYNISNIGSYNRYKIYIIDNSGNELLFIESTNSINESTDETMKIKFDPTNVDKIKFEIFGLPWDIDSEPGDSSSVPYVSHGYKEVDI